MELLHYFLLTISTFLGTFFGLFLANMAAEELSSAKKYLAKTTSIFIPAIIFILLIEESILYAIIASLIALILLLKFEGRYKDSIIYCSSGSLLYVCTLAQSSIAIISSSLLFIYAMMLVTLDATAMPIQKDKKIGSSLSKKTNLLLAKEISVKYFAYMIVAMFFYIIFEYLVIV